MVAVGAKNGSFEIAGRRRIELIDDGEAWAKQPYHAAEDLPVDEARALVARGIASAYYVAEQRLSEISEQIREHHHIAGCAVVMPAPMPEWNTDEILSVHFRMHKAEGILFPRAIIEAVRKLGLPAIEVPQKTMEEQAKMIVGEKSGVLLRRIAELGKSIGPPWRKDQKDATTAALIALAQLDGFEFSEE